jgi:hypothetical protein
LDHPGVITMANLLTFAAAAGEVWATPWVPWPAEVSRRQLAIGVKTILVGRLGAQLQTSWDGVTPVNVGSRLGISMPETRVVEDTAAMGPWVRLELHSDGAAPDPTECVFSAWATPKRY